jgi:hypothetical protein
VSVAYSAFTLTCLVCWQHILPSHSLVYCVSAMYSHGLLASHAFLLSCLQQGCEGRICCWHNANKSVKAAYTTDTCKQESAKAEYTAATMQTRVWRKNMLLTHVQRRVWRQNKLLTHVNKKVWRQNTLLTQCKQECYIRNFGSLYNKQYN